jgi:transcriptional regulator with XRE-family HTH domain
MPRTPLSPTLFVDRDPPAGQPIEERVRDLLRLVEIGQSELAEALGVRQSAVSMWFSGTRRPTITTWSDIAGAITTLVLHRLMDHLPPDLRALPADARRRLREDVFGPRLSLAARAAVHGGIMTAPASAWAETLDLNVRALRRLPKIPPGIMGYDVGLLMLSGARGYSYADLVRRDEDRYQHAPAGEATLANQAGWRLQLAADGIPPTLTMDRLHHAP